MSRSPPEDGSDSHSSNCLIAWVGALAGVSIRLPTCLLSRVVGDIILTFETSIVKYEAKARLQELFAGCLISDDRLGHVKALVSRHIELTLMAHNRIS